MDLSAVKPIDVVTLVKDPAAEDRDTIAMIYLPSIACGQQS
jgi:hypothetical protein